MLQVFSKIWDFSKERHSALGIALVASFLKSVFGVTQVYAIILAIQAIMGEKTVRESAIEIGILMAVCIIGNFAASYIEQIKSLETGFFMIGDKRVAVGNVLRRVPLGFFSETSVGSITATLTTTLAGVETAASMSLLMIVSGLLGTLVLLISILFYEWRIGITAALGMVSYLLVVSWQMKVSRKHAPMLTEAQSRLAQAALTFFQGIKVTKAFCFSEGDRELKNAMEGSKNANIGLTNKSMPSQFAANLTIAVFESLLLVETLYFCFVLKDISIVKSVVLIVFSFMVYASLNQAGSVLSMIGLLDSGLAEVEKLEQTKQMTYWEPVQTAVSNDIELKEVSFSYGEHEILHNISTIIKQGSFTAIIGPSGSGKTTLCQMIPRFRETTAGTIRIGGADVRYMEPEELMKKVSMVFQRVYLFEDTILNNIRFGKPEATLEEVRKAAKAARCDEFIMKLPNGYDTIVEEGGNSLSGGEKQRISIARAILKDSPIIILDEATSALDAENEQEILAAMDELTKNKTVIMIAHRIKSVQKADHIIAIDGGRIVQEGTHEELLKENGLYRDFITARERAAGWKLEVR